MNAVVLPSGTYFFCDTQINTNTSAGQIADMTLLAAEEVRRFGITPKVALLSHSNFGSQQGESARKMRNACQLIRQQAPELEIDGEMQADAALSEEIRSEIMPYSTLQGSANVLIMPDVESANIAYNLIKILGEGISIGPLLLGAARPAHIMTPAATPRNIINVTALATIAAQVYETEIAGGRKSFI
jgi:malate dehydrogenase (oxaloacetate-decarboxylating)(NADP+)